MRRVFTASLGALVLTAVSANWQVARADEANSMVIKDFMFSPMSITVKAGSMVTWKNLDDEPHSVVNDAGLFRSAALDQDETFQYKFDKPGVYRIFCGIHPNMKATITVQ